jgi:hypothetical protein
VRTFSVDRAFAAFLIVGTVVLIITLVFPEALRSLDRWFDWGLAEIMGTGGWAATCIALAIALVAGLSRR